MNLGRHFKAPKKDDLKQWEKVQLLVNHGFRFHKVYDEDGVHICYPETLEEAKEFVVKYKKFAWP